MVLTTTLSGENARTTVWRFLAKFASLIVCTLHCFDRVIFKGHLALSAPNELERFVDYVLKVRRSHFMNVIAPGYSDQLVEHAKQVAAAAGRTYLYRCGSFRKDQWAEQLIREQRLERGLVGDRFAKLNWPAVLNRYAHQVHPLLHKVLDRYRVRWVVDQAEFATDLLFTSPTALAGLYQKLLQFATVTFTPPGDSNGSDPPGGILSASVTNNHTRFAPEGNRYLPAMTKNVP